MSWRAVSRLSRQNCRVRHAVNVQINLRCENIIKKVHNVLTIYLYCLILSRWNRKKKKWMPTMTLLIVWLPATATNCLLNLLMKARAIQFIHLHLSVFPTHIMINSILIIILEAPKIRILSVIKTELVPTRKLRCSMTTMRAKMLILPRK